MTFAQDIIQENVDIAIIKELVINPALVFDEAYREAWLASAIIHPQLLAVLISHDHWLDADQMNAMENGALEILPSLVGFLSQQEMEDYWGTDVISEAYACIEMGEQYLIDLLDRLYPNEEEVLEVEVIPIEECPFIPDPLPSDDDYNRLDTLLEFPREKNTEQLNGDGYRIQEEGYMYFDANGILKLSFYKSYTATVGFEKLTARIKSLGCSGHIRHDVSDDTHPVYDGQKVFTFTFTAIPVDAYQKLAKLYGCNLPLEYSLVDEAPKDVINGNPNYIACEAYMTYTPDTNELKLTAYKEWATEERINTFLDNMKQHKCKGSISEGVAADGKPAYILRFNVINQDMYVYLGKQYGINLPTQCPLAGKEEVAKPQPQQEKPATITPPVKTAKKVGTFKLSRKAAVKKVRDNSFESLRKDLVHCMERNMTPDAWRKFAADAGVIAANAKVKLTEVVAAIVNGVLDGRIDAIPHVPSEVLAPYAI